MSEVTQEAVTKRIKKRTNGKPDKVILANLNMLTARLATVEKERTADHVLLEELTRQVVDLKEQRVTKVEEKPEDREAANLAQLEAMMGEGQVESPESPQPQPEVDVEPEPQPKAFNKRWLVLIAGLVLLVVAGFLVFTYAKGGLG